MGYRPEYAKGEIVVQFLVDVNCNKGFVKAFGDILGYEVIEKEGRQYGYFIFKTKEGDEKKACERFKAEKTFVDYAVRRDTKLESEYENLEQAIDMLRNLIDDVPLPKGGYKKKLDEIIDYIQKIKK